MVTINKDEIKRSVLPEIKNVNQMLEYAKDGIPSKNLPSDFYDLPLLSFILNGIEESKTIVEEVGKIIVSILLEFEAAESTNIDIINSLSMHIGNNSQGLGRMSQQVWELLQQYYSIFSNAIELDLQVYLRQFSTTTGAPRSADSNFYKMYGDGGNKPGWPTIGDADIQWGSHSHEFDVPGKVLLPNGEIKHVDSIRDYVGSIMNHSGKYTNNEIDKMNIYIEVGVVDEVGKKISSNILDKVEKDTKGLDLSKQQQYALTAIAYNFGSLPKRGGKTFSQVYKEGAKLYGENTWQHNMYIWDNWWSKLRGGAAGHIPARDASFETYVKGIYDLNESEAGGVFNRSHYVYYTSEQIDSISEAPNKPITRTRSNEDEIFEYKENNGVTSEDEHVPIMEVNIASNSQQSNNSTTTNSSNNSSNQKAGEKVVVKAMDDVADEIKDYGYQGTAGVDYTFPIKDCNVRNERGDKAISCTAYVQEVLLQAGFDSMKGNEKVAIMRGDPQFLVDKLEDAGIESKVVQDTIRPGDILNSRIEGYPHVRLVYSVKYDENGDPISYTAKGVPEVLSSEHYVATHNEGGFGFDGEQFIPVDTVLGRDRDYDIIRPDYSDLAD